MTKLDTSSTIISTVGYFSIHLPTDREFWVVRLVPRKYPVITDNKTNISESFFRKG